MNILKTTELYTLNGEIEWFGNYISIKVLIKLNERQLQIIFGLGSKITA